jgi:hypothetical protein
LLFKDRDLWDESDIDTLMKRNANGVAGSIVSVADPAQMLCQYPVYYPHQHHLRRILELVALIAM